MFVQRFEHGDVAPVPTSVFEAVFRSYVDKSEPEFDFLHIRVPDGGEADIYARLVESTFDGLMINNFSPGTVLDLLAEFARRAGAVILPPGCPVLVTDPDQCPHLPGYLPPDPVVIATGADIEAALRSAHPGG